MNSFQSFDFSLMKPDTPGAAYTHQQVIIPVGLALGELD